MLDFAGQQIRGYRIDGEIGSGGYGAVYQAYQESVGRDVAIKMILPQHANQPEFRANFETEARLVAQLEHPHIVPLYDYWQDENGAFLVMRYIKGGSLRELMRKQGALPLVQVTRIITQIAEALQVSHQADVVHRDLKPDNILIDLHGNAYLTDFGIAKQTGQDGASATDAIKGTFAYLSPEQIQQTTISPQTDIYALGIMLYEMLAGKHPFHETPVAMMIVKHLEETLPELSESRPELPTILDEIIATATAKEAPDRYTSTQDIAEALKNINDTSARAQHAAPSTATPLPVRIAAKTPSTPEERNRHAMLQSVHKFWVEGVLENSLHGAAMIELGMKAETGAVDNPWDTLLRTPEGEERLPPGTRIADIFERLNGKLLILGDPGGGKTTTMLDLARDLLARATADSEHPIPVVFNLSSWSENQLPLTEWLVEELSSKYQVPRKVGNEWVENDNLLLLLDGLDEVALAVRDACVEAINAYREEHGFVDIVVCSRIRDYEALTGHLNLNGAIVIQALNEEQVDEYLSNLGPETGSIRTMLANDEQLRDLSRSPLMLSIMALAYRGVSTQTVPDFDTVEQQRKHIFDTYVQRMFDRRIGKKAYTQEETIHYLSWLAQQMQQHAQSVFHIENLQPSWLPTPEQAARFPFVIRVVLGSFLGFFWFLAAVVSVMILPFHPIYIPLFTLSAFIYGYLFTHPLVFSGVWYKTWSIYILIGALIATAISIGYGLHEDMAIGLAMIVPTTLVFSIVSMTHIRWMRVKFLSRYDQIVPVERIRFSVEAMEWRIVVLFSLSASSGLLSYGGLYFADQLTITPRGAGLAFIVGMVLPSCILSGLDGFTGDQLQMRLRPNEGIYASIRNGAFFIPLVQVAQASIVLGLIILGLPLKTAFLFWLILFLMFGSDTVLSHGGVPFFQHIILRHFLRRQGSTPRNLTRFLDHAAALVLMRKVGGGYVFIHRYLLEYFAELKET